MLAALLWGLGLLLIAAIALWIVLISAPGHRETYTLQRADRPKLVEHRGFRLHFHHWFPKWRRGFDVTAGGHSWLRDPEHQAVPTGPAVQRWMLAHVVLHDVQEAIEGPVRYTLGSLWELLTVWTWGKRPREIEVNKLQTTLALTGSVTGMVRGTIVTIDAPFLLVYDNYEMPK